MKFLIFLTFLIGISFQGKADDIMGTMKGELGKPNPLNTPYSPT